MHGHGHISEYVFDTTTNFGFTTVILFLLLGQRLVTVSFFADLVANVFGQFLANIGTVGVYVFISDTSRNIAKVHTTPRRKISVPELYLELS